MVEDPYNLFELKMLETLFIIAIKTPFASTPGWEQKFLSSTDKKKFIIFSGIALNETRIRVSVDTSLTNSTFPEYT